MKKYKIALLGVLPSPKSAWGVGVDRINSSGVMVGSSNVGSNPKPTMWRRGEVLLLETPDHNTYGYCRDINDSDQVVGYIGYRFYRAVKWVNNKLYPLKVPNGEASQALAVNNKGVIVGWHLPSSSKNKRACLWLGEKMHDIGTLGGAMSEAHNINNAGLVVGSSTTINGEEHAFAWNTGKMHDLGTLGGKASWATAVNDHGVIVGKSITQEGNCHACMWSGGTLFDLVEDSGIREPNAKHKWSAFSITNSGMILVNGFRPEGDHSVDDCSYVLATKEATIVPSLEKPKALFVAELP